MLPANVRLDWKVFAGEKGSRKLRLDVSKEVKKVL